MKEVKLQFCFFHESPKNKFILFHTHPVLEVIYYLKGRAELHIGSRYSTVSSNWFAVVPPGVRHDHRSLSDLNAVCMGLTNSQLEAYKGCWIDRDGSVRKVCNMLMLEVKHRNIGTERVVGGLSNSLVGYIQRACSQTKAADKGDLVQTALELIDREDGKISVNDLSECLFISKDYLRNMFYKSSRHSPIHYIINKKMENAKRLLLNRSLSISEVALQCGFQNSYYFSRLFKKHLNRTPTEFRKSSLDKCR